MSGNALLGRYWLGDRLSVWKKIAILLPVFLALRANLEYLTGKPNYSHIYTTIIVVIDKTIL
jgi:hypothetical protein